jgi:hypothetical protein
MGDESLFWTGRLDALMTYLGLLKRNQRLPGRPIVSGYLYFSCSLQVPADSLPNRRTAQSGWSRVYLSEHRRRIARFSPTNALPKESSNGP